MKLIYLILLVLTFWGCSSKLTVDIKILQRKYMTENEDVLSARLDASESALILAPSNNNRIKAELKAKVQQHLQTYSCLYAKEQIPKIQADANKRIDKEIDNVNDILSLALQKKNDAALLTEPSVAKVKLLKEALNLINKATFSSANIQNLVDLFVVVNPTECEVSTAQAKLAKQEVKQIIQEVKNITRPITEALNDDPLASIAVSAPKDAWKHPINSTKAKASIGNSDMAVVMQSNGGFNEYTIKGIRNDASQATRALFSLLNVTVGTLASAYGMGFSTAKSDTAKNYVKEALEVDSQREELDDNARTSQAVLLNAILSQRANLNDGAKYQEAVGKIQETFSVEKKKLTN